MSIVLAAKMVGLPPVFMHEHGVGGGVIQVIVQFKRFQYFFCILNLLHQPIFLSTFSKLKELVKFNLGNEVPLLQDLCAFQIIHNEGHERTLASLTNLTKHLINLNQCL